MSFQPNFPGIFTPAKGAQPAAHPATPKQLAFAQKIALRLGQPLPQNLAQNRAKLSDWIENNKSIPPANRFQNYPSSKQVAFAERIARIKHRDIPRECFHDKKLMSKWIDSNKPH